MKKSLKTVLIILAVIFVMAVVLVVYKFVKNGNDDKTNGENKTIETQKMLGKYVSILSGNCYIRYTGNIKNLDGNAQKATIEASKKGNIIAMNSKDLGIAYIDDKEVAYSISHRAKTVIKISDSNQLQGNAYNYIFIRDLENFEKQYVGNGEEKIDGVKYEYEDYKESESVVVRYYFLRGDLKYIRLSDNDNKTTVQIIDINSNPKENLFKIPSEYKSLST